MKIVKGGKSNNESQIYWDAIQELAKEMKLLDVKNQYDRHLMQFLWNVSTFKILGAPMFNELMDSIKELVDVKSYHKELDKFSDLRYKKFGHLDSFIRTIQESDSSNPKLDLFNLDNTEGHEVMNLLDEFIKGFNQTVIENASDIKWVGFESSEYDESYDDFDVDMGLNEFYDDSDELGIVDRDAYILTLKEEYKDFNLGPYVVLLDPGQTAKEIDKVIKDTFGDIEAMIADQNFEDVVTSYKDLKKYFNFIKAAETMDLVDEPLTKF